MRDIRIPRAVVRKAGLDDAGVNAKRLRGVPDDAPAVPLEHGGPMRLLRCLDAAPVAADEVEDLTRGHLPILLPRPWRTRARDAPIRRADHHGTRGAGPVIDHADEVRPRTDLRQRVPRHVMRLVELEVLDRRGRRQLGSAENRIAPIFFGSMPHSAALARTILIADG